MYLDYYLDKLGYSNRPGFINKYLEDRNLCRLKNVGYFCGMDYASKDIYDFREYISRYDHSLSVALLTYKLTGDKASTIAGLFHDIATPCFSHVIDYMNKDYEKQESTEEYVDNIVRHDNYLASCFKKDRISVEDIINFKKFSVVDNDRPKLCADRLDGVILTGIGWTKNIELSDIDDILGDLKIYTNEFGESEIGFKTYDIAKKVVDVSKSIDIYCHSNEDNYMMELLAKIARLAIEKGYIKYNDLYTMNEEELFCLLKHSNDFELSLLLREFRKIKKSDIPSTEIPNLKPRKLSPLVNGDRVFK